MFLDEENNKAQTRLLDSVITNMAVRYEIGVFTVTGWRSGIYHEDSTV